VVELLVESARENDVDADFADWNGDATTPGSVPPISPELAAVAPRSIAIGSGEQLSDTIGDNLIDSFGTFSVFVKRPTSGIVQVVVGSSEICTFTLHDAADGDEDGAADCGDPGHAVDVGGGWARVDVRLTLNDTLNLGSGSGGEGMDAWWPQLEPGDTATSPLIDSDDGDNMALSPINGHKRSISTVARLSPIHQFLIGAGNKQIDIVTDVDTEVLTANTFTGPNFGGGTNFSEPFQLVFTVGNPPGAPACTIIPCIIEDDGFDLAGFNNDFVYFDVPINLDALDVPPGPRFYRKVQVTTDDP
jgi:hypothetical protein